MKPTLTIHAVLAAAGALDSLYCPNCGGPITIYADIDRWHCPNCFAVEGNAFDLAECFACEELRNSAVVTWLKAHGLSDPAPLTARRCCDAHK